MKTMSTAESATAARFDDEPAEVVLELPRPVQRWWSLARWPSSLLFCVSFATLVALWQLATVLFDIKAYTLPSPYAIGEGVVENAGLLWRNTGVTVIEILAAFGLAVVIAMPIAAAIAFSRVLDKLVYPLLIAGQNIPKVAIAPIMVLWFGFGFKSNVAIGASIAVFPVIINTALGLNSIDPGMVRLGRSMGGTPLRILWKIRLPNAMPSIFAGLKLGMTFAVIGAIIGEFVSGSEGLGYIIQVATGQLRTVLAFSSMVVLSVVGIALYYAVEAAERLSIRWHSSQHKGGG